MIKEEWKDIKGYEGLYQVSNLGRVKSLARYVGHLRKGKQLVKEKMLKHTKDGRGYLGVTLCKNGEQKNYTIHRLVASAFIDNPKNYPQVNHIDEKKMNNCAENLEWCNRKYNMNYGTRRERQILNTNYTEISRKLSKKVYQYSLQGELVNVWDSTIQAASHGFNQGHIASCCRGELKTHKGFIWSYKKEVIRFDKNIS